MRWEMFDDVLEAWVALILKAGKITKRQRAVLLILKAQSRL